MDCYCFLKAKPEIWLCPHHRYFKGEMEFKSVSSIIRAVRPTDYSNVRPIVLNIARLRGTFVDEYFSDWLVTPHNEMAPLREFREVIEGKFPIDRKKHAEDVIKRIAVLMDWWVETDRKVVAVQKIVCSEKDRIAGTLDLWIDEWILDLKCVSKLQDNYSIQLGAYSNYSDHSLSVGILWVPQGKKPKIIPYDALKCRIEWKVCLAEYSAS